MLPWHFWLNQVLLDPIILSVFWFHSAILLLGRENKKECTRPNTGDEPRFNTHTNKGRILVHSAMQTNTARVMPLLVLPGAVSPGWTLLLHLSILANFLSHSSIRWVHVLFFVWQLKGKSWLHSTKVRPWRNRAGGEKSKYFGFVESWGNAFPEVERQEVDS